MAAERRGATQRSRCRSRRSSRCSSALCCAKRCRLGRCSEARASWRARGWCSRHSGRSRRCDARSLVGRCIPFVGRANPVPAHDGAVERGGSPNRKIVMSRARLEGNVMPTPMPTQRHPDFLRARRGPRDCPSVHAHSGSRLCDPSTDFRPRAPLARSWRRDNARTHSICAIDLSMNRWKEAAIVSLMRSGLCLETSESAGAGGIRTPARGSTRGSTAGSLRGRATWGPGGSRASHLASIRRDRQIRRDHARTERGTSVATSHQ